MNKSPVANLPALSDAELQAKADHFRWMSDCASDNYRSPYHKWFYQCYLEIERRKKRYNQRGGKL